MSLDASSLPHGPHPSVAPVGGNGGTVLPPEPSMLEAALWYARQGFNPIPQDRAKKPLVKWGLYQDRPVTEEEIREWWTRWPDANIAIVTGAVSGLVVLDFDGPEGRKSFSELPGTDAATGPVVLTGNGFHVYFSHPGGPVKTITKIRPGLDIKGDGGLVTVPPSVHKSGAVYTFADGYSLDDLSPADIPEPLLAILRDGATTFIGSQGRGLAFGRLRLGTLGLRLRGSFGRHQTRRQLGGD